MVKYILRNEGYMGGINVNWYASATVQCNLVKKFFKVLNIGNAGNIKQHLYFKSL